MLFIISFLIDLTRLLKTFYWITLLLYKAILSCLFLLEIFWFRYYLSALKVTTALCKSISAVVAHDVKSVTLVSRANFICTVYNMLQLNSSNFIDAIKLLRFCI